MASSTRKVIVKLEDEVVDAAGGEAAATAESLAADAAPAPAEAPGGAAALAEMLVRLLEQDGALVHAQSSLRRLLVLAIGRELDLPAGQLDALALAALLSGLGEVSLSGPGAPSGDPVRPLSVTLQLLSAVPLPAGVREAVAAQHERWDGTGPEGLREEQTPLLARVLAVGRAAAALLASEPDAAVATAELQKQAGSAFDPVVVSVLRRVFAQRERHGIGYGWGGRVAVAHPQELRALDLSARLHANGYAVETAGTARALKDGLRDAAPQALVLGAELPDADAASLIREVRSVPALAALPVVVIDAVEPMRRVALLAAGADLCFGPEVGYPEFKASLDALLRRFESAFPREETLQVVSL